MAISVANIKVDVDASLSSLGIDSSTGGITLSGSPNVIANGDTIITSLEKIDTKLGTVDTTLAGLDVGKANLAGATFTGNVTIGGSSTFNGAFTVDTSTSLEAINIKGPFIQIAEPGTSSKIRFGGAIQSNLRPDGAGYQIGNITNYWDRSYIAEPISNISYIGSVTLNPDDTIATSKWSFSVNAMDELVFSYNGNGVAKIGPTGVISTAANVLQMQSI